jgi:Flp pilus assembly protein TadG
VVEAVLLVPVLMLLLLVAVQFCLWMHAAQVAQLAASEGDRVARSYGGGPSAGVDTARQVLQGQGSDVTSPSVRVSVLPSDSEWLRVTGHAVSVVPGLSFAVSASATGPIQEFRSSE